MAHLYRVTVLIALMFFSSFANAVIPKNGPVFWQVEGGSNASLGSDLVSGWRAWITGLYGSANNGACTSSGNTGFCTSTYMNQPVIGVPSSCPSNSAEAVGNTSFCQCNSGFVEDSTKTACELPCDLPKKQVAVITDTGTSTTCQVPSCKAGASGVYVERNKVGGAMPSTSFECVAGCVAKTDFSFGLKYTDGNGVVQDKAVGETVFSGTACATNTADGSTSFKPAPLDSTTNPNSAKTAQCPVGQSLRFVNGVSVCGPVGLGDETTTSKTTSSTDAAGNKTDVTSTTKCVGSTCTTSTATTVTPNGGAPATTTKEDTKDKTTFCQDNPTLSICKEGSFSGSCASAPACTGDAVMCAVAAATFATNCALTMPDTSPENSAYDLAKTKTGDQTGALLGNSSLTVGPTDFNSANILGAAAGMHDVSITVVGQSISLPFSTINPWLEKLGSLLQAVTFLICAYIVTGNKQGGAA